MESTNNKRLAQFAVKFICFFNRLPKNAVRNAAKNGITVKKTRIFIR